jgi:hypothetical protein
MDTFVLAFQIFNILLLAAWLVLAVAALLQLRHAALSESIRLGWAALIVLIPIIGAIAFFIVRPGRE